MITPCGARFFLEDCFLWNAQCPVILSVDPDVCVLDHYESPIYRDSFRSGPAGFSPVCLHQISDQGNLQAGYIARAEPPRRFNQPRSSSETRGIRLFAAF